MLRLFPVVTPFTPGWQPRHVDRKHQRHRHMRPYNDELRRQFGPRATRGSYRRLPLEDLDGLHLCPSCREAVIEAGETICTPCFYDNETARLYAALYAEEVK